MIIFRADGNRWIGTGHIMRCLSLADALQEQDREALFIIADSDFQPLIQQRGHLCTVLGTAYDQMEEELPVILPILERQLPELVIVDSYFVTQKYLTVMKNTARLLYIDDRNAFDYPADAVVNYNIYGPAMSYPQNKTYFLGPRYAPLRKEFRGPARRLLNERVANVLVSTGGTDQYHVALRCVEYLLEQQMRDDIIFHFVLGAMNSDVDLLEQISAECPFVVLHQRVTDMRGLMLACDAAVSAAGSTLYELCACGLPTVTYVLADNQIESAAAFEKAGLMLHGGDVRTSRRFARDVFAKLKLLAENAPLRMELSRRMQQMVDGNGAERLAGALTQLKYYREGETKNEENSNQQTGH